ncbi:Helix-turn-helix domain-containing protein [Tenacibaculum sp. MAR_2009_124]|uniref:helix-turn-helix domain-containing protein n=1 Tax=Tenacibaculum sp. MAR_2009_124 TaxID=1250059 RepID=UPI00089D6CAA|nr:helix-turn-helix domain-containing protein [Tenacibaculum sp. MAR_2009_124]SEB53048.1 Helix-turn-helix domain-containing protein [Tenacibaculum sp. MAR_2009_124]
MVKTHYKPSKYLSSYVDRYFVCKQNIGLPLILPGTGLELLFHLNKPLSIDGVSLPKAHTICPRTAIQFDHNNHIEYLAVRFKSGAFRHFTSIPYFNIVNQYLSVEDIWSIDGKQLSQQLNDLTLIEEKIKCIEIFLLKKLSKYKSTESVHWNASLHQLYREFNSISFLDLALKCNISYRQYERNFKQKFGITPKKFQRITRLQKTAKEVLLNKTDSYLHIALDNGYYDQSHFIKEFKNLSGITPSEYFIKDNFSNHFYYKSI